MPIESFIKYQFAFDHTNQIVNVNFLEKGNTRQARYRCVSCGRSLIPVLGKVRKKHFRHEVEDNCSYETYLHKLAKSLFFQNYSESITQKLPFYLEFRKRVLCKGCIELFGFTCDIEWQLSKIDLPNFFPIIKLETPSDGYIPDVLLSNSKNERIYVEFEVTHASSEKKIKSGQKIIEISIDSEEDLEPILQRKLSTIDINIKLMNFQFHDKVVNIWDSCKTSKDFFTISPDGGARVVTNTPKFMKYQFDKGTFYQVKYMKEVDHYYYVKELQEAYWKKWNIKNCFLCRYHALNHYRDENSGPIYCKFRKKPYVSTEAVKCEYYRPDPEVFPINDKRS